MSMGVSFVKAKGLVSLSCIAKQSTLCALKEIQDKLDLTLSIFLFTDSG